VKSSHAGDERILPACTGDLEASKYSNRSLADLRAADLGRAACQIGFPVAIRATEATHVMNTYR
jgi:hypothetical protein